MRWLVASFAVHLLLLGAAVFLHAPPAAHEHVLVVEAPLGGVFVREKETAQPAPAVVESGPGRAAEAASPLDAGKTPAVEAVSAPVPGVPDGEANALAPVRPTYPALSRRLGEEGEVVFVISVGADGRITGIATEKSSGHSRLDEAARAALLASHFQPAIRAGVPVASQKRMQIEFKLRNP